MKSVQKIDLGLTGYDELFMNDAERKENKLPRIYDIPLSEIDDFPDHPFKVKLDEDMDQLVQSIKERGIITPVTLRPKEDGRYEIVSGHRRKKACELAGFDTVKAEVREMTRDEAIILMVESNLQRSVILPSEKAFSYKMRLEAMKRQGQRSDLTSTPVVSKSRSNEELGSEHGESREQVRRYIRLTELIPELLDLVDEGRIAFRPAVELSYLQKDEQSVLLEQKEQLAELLAQDNSMWAAVLYGIYGVDDQIVAVALSQVGNVGGEPYWSWYGFGSRVEWCACFVSWCANECGYIDTGVIPKFAGCVNGVQWFRERGQWADNSMEPSPGMIIFFDWDNKGSSGPQDGQSDHVGIVQKVKNGVVYTIEGNSGDSCRVNQYPVGHYEILGYGVVAY